jgi:hypothetical protein
MSSYRDIQNQVRLLSKEHDIERPKLNSKKDILINWLAKNMNKSNDKTTKKKKNKDLTSTIEKRTRKKENLYKNGRISARAYYDKYGESSIGNRCDIRNDGTVKCLLLNKNGHPYWSNTTNKQQCKKLCQF